MLKINEIFYSIQGESSYVGYPTVFIRTTGCNLRCTYCDTQYSYHEGNFISFDSIVNKVKAFEAEYVCLTGGEPLLQQRSFDLMSHLCDEGYLVSCETSGSKSIEAIDSRVKIILDVKTPDSGAPHSFLMKNLQWISSSTEVKFVLCSKEDFQWAENFCRQHNLFSKCLVLYSPSFGQMKESWLAEEILQKKSKARLQLQLHKYIWSPNVRGV